MSGEAPRGMTRSSVNVMSVMRIAPGSGHQGSMRADSVAVEFGERAASSGIILGADTALSMAPFPGGSDPPAAQPRARKNSSSTPIGESIGNMSWKASEFKRGETKTSSEINLQTVILSN